MERGDILSGNLCSSEAPDMADAYVLLPCLYISPFRR